VIPSPVVEQTHNLILNAVNAALPFFNLLLHARLSSGDAKCPGPQGCASDTSNTCSPMSRRYQEIEEKARKDAEGAKAALKRLGDRERAFLIAWLCKYIGDEGAMLSPQISKERRIVVIDGVEYWLVRVPKVGHRTGTQAGP
jgi:hypothetical protein